MNAFGSVTRAPSARPSPMMWRTGSFSRPLSGAVNRSASASVSTARTTAFRSPRTPEPLSANTSATRSTYAGLGLLVTSDRISRVATNGGTFGMREDGVERRAHVGGW